MDTAGCTFDTLHQLWGDALGGAYQKKTALPAAEVHISDVTKRESFRSISYAGMACGRHYIGMGFDGYLKAMEDLVKDISSR